MNQRNELAIRSFYELSRHYSKHYDDFFFIQIGANDGRNGDPLYGLVSEFGWHGILVEPQKWVFENLLVKTYADNKNLKFENVAIDEVNGHRKLFKLSFSQRRWATGLASFKKSHLEHHIDAGYIERMIGDERDLLPLDQSQYITSELIPTMTFDSLINKYDVRKIDLLQIDTEGHDYKLLQLFDFNRIKPAIIQFEHHVMTETQRTITRDLLEGVNYASFIEHINIVGVQRDIIEKLGIRLEVQNLR